MQVIEGILLLDYHHRQNLLNATEELRANEKHEFQNDPSGRAKNKAKQSKIKQNNNNNNKIQIIPIKLVSKSALWAYLFLSYSAYLVHRQRRLLQRISQKTFRRRDRDVGGESVARMHWKRRHKRSIESTISICYSYSLSESLYIFISFSFYLFSYSMLHVTCWAFKRSIFSFALVIESLFLKWFSHQSLS